MPEAKDEDKTVHDEPMQHRQIILEDGRYLIFYTFGRSGPPASARGEEGKSVEKANDV